MTKKGFVSKEHTKPAAPATKTTPFRGAGKTRRPPIEETSTPKQSRGSILYTKGK